MITGVDLSNWQHPAGSTIDYTRAVGAGVSFALIEFKDELGAENPYFLADHAGFRSVGVVTGSYVFVRPELPLPPQAADLRGLGKYGPVWADFEVTGGLSPAALVAWWSELLNEAPETNLCTYKAFLGNVPTAALTALPWIDAWGEVKPPMAACRIWGMTDAAEVPGIPTLVDLDSWIGTQSQLETAFGSAPAVPALAPASGLSIAAAASSPTGVGYWLATPAGDVFAHGEAAYHGSPAKPFPNDLVAILPTPTGRGYRLVTRRGFVGNYGDARLEKPSSAG